MWQGAPRPSFLSDHLLLRLSQAGDEHDEYIQMKLGAMDTCLTKKITKIQKRNQELESEAGLLLEFLTCTTAAASKLWGMEANPGKVKLDAANFRTEQACIKHCCSFAGHCNCHCNPVASGRSTS